MFSLTAQKIGYAGVTQEYNISGEDALSAYNQMVNSGEYVYVVINRYRQPVATWINPLAHDTQKRLGRADDTHFTIVDPNHGFVTVVPIVKPKEEYYGENDNVYDFS